MMLNLKTKKEENLKLQVAKYCVSHYLEYGLDHT